MQKSLIAIVAAVVGLLLVDQLIYRDYRENNTFAVHEAFLQKGSLGKLLRENSLIQISPDTAALAKNDMCATDADIKNYNYHNTYRLRFKIFSTYAETLNVNIEFPKAKRYRQVIDLIHLHPGRQFYTVSFVAHKGLDFKITLSKKSQNNILISDILVDGRFGRTQAILEQGKVVLGGFDKERTVVVDEEKRTAGVEFQAQESSMTYTVSGGLGDDLYSGVFPGKENEGFCRYVAYKPTVLASTRQSVVPTVDLAVEQQYLYGEQGIIDNKQGKGRVWEVPAKYSVRNAEQVSNHVVGLRFHGGVPGRKKSIESFRINARKAYGRSTIDIEPLMGRARATDLKGVVFKYTYQAYDLNRTFYNPYNHALALDIAHEVGALAPAHALVDLMINGESKGLFLAMEHLSDRTLAHWLGRSDFKTYTYKKYNDEHQQFALFYPVGEILNHHGEEAFALFEQAYDVNNVLNSILLSAYISDDDYCQGVEVIEQVKDSDQRKITSVNWDLDHAFLYYENGQFSMPAQRKDHHDGFDILKQNKPHHKSLCPRKWVYSHLYTESETFRGLVKERLDALLQNELSPENINKLLDRYRVIDEGYYQGKYLPIIEQMADYARKRPALLKENLAKLERQVTTAPTKPKADIQ